VLRPDVVLRLAAQIVEETTPYRRTRRAMLAAVEELARAVSAGQLKIAPREVPWLDRLRKQVDALPEQEQELIDEVLNSEQANRFLPVEYELRRDA